MKLYKYSGTIEELAVERGRIQLDNLFAILTEKTNRSHNKTHDN